MKFDIDEKVVAAAVKCTKNHGCLKCRDHVYCAVEACLMSRVLFVRCRHAEPCTYKKDVEGFTVCTCPVRKEIFNRYGR